MYSESFGCLENGEFHTRPKVMRAFFKLLVVDAALVSLLFFMRPLSLYLIPRRLHDETKTRSASPWRRSASALPWASNPTAPTS